MNWMSQPFDMQLTDREPRRLKEEEAPKKEAPKVYGLFDPIADKKKKLLNMAAKWKLAQQKKKDPTPAATAAATATTTVAGTAPTTAPTTATPPEPAAPMFWKPGTKPRAAPTPSPFLKPGSHPPQHPTHPTQPSSAPPPPAAPTQGDKNKAALAALRQSLHRPKTTTATKPTQQLAPLEREDLRSRRNQGKKYKSDQGATSQNYTGLKNLLDDGADNMDDVYARNILKQGKRFKMKASSRSGRDEEEEVDVSMYNKPQHALTQRKKDEVEQQRQAHYNKQQEQAASRDRYNLRNPAFPRHRLIATGEHSYLMLPSQRDSLCWGHMMLVPIDSVHTIVQADENVWDEMARYQHVIETAMQKGEPNDYEHEPLGVVYLETAITVNRPHHTVIHCIPVSYDVLEDLPIYFKKGLTEVGDEWSTHKKIIDTNRNEAVGKNIRHSIPPNFPYFHVEWSGGRYSSGGYAHVIEGNFPLNFGQDVVRGLLGQNPSAFGRKDRGGGRNGGGNVNVEVAKVKELKEVLKGFDTVSKG